MLKKLCLLLLIILTGCSSESDKPNIVFVVLDTVRSDAAGGNTPAFNRLAS